MDLLEPCLIGIRTIIFNIFFLSAVRYNKLKVILGQTRPPPTCGYILIKPTFVDGFLRKHAV